MLPQPLTPNILLILFRSVTIVSVVRIRAFTKYANTTNLTRRFSNSRK